MHPKEFKKVKNGTGHLTHLALKNSELFVGVDFSAHETVNNIIKTYESFVLYPSKDAINISKNSINNAFDDTKPKKGMAIFIIDSTWSCSITMLRESKNLHSLKHISFESTKRSEFQIKEQPQEYCLSTIESTLSILELLQKDEMESFKRDDLNMFLNPFYKMIDYQLQCIANPKSNAVRYKKRKPK